ncbi:hypothetical protein [Rhodococcus sp. 05-2254-6]|uniref:hypothetical protein n=1 Tax=Rhodococcus sp. 05-2254-6 TaxID=2022489 RepID=UPI001179E92D|nr:hypothetical protein [Rhodococcus sp. 05-2254-6]
MNIVAAQAKTAHPGGMDRFAEAEHHHSACQTATADDSTISSSIEAFFAGLSWKVVLGEWVGTEYELEFTSDHYIVLPEYGNVAHGKVLRGEGYRCTDNSCGFEDLTGQRVHRERVELVDLEATIARLTAGAA